MRQFSTLLWKEWRQLRAVRWSGALLGAVLLVILLASTLFGETGSPNALGYRTPSLEDVALDAAPVVFAGFLWPLICLLAAVQAFSGDRSARCEEFLLLLPVSRAKTWFARLLAASASYVVSAAASGLLLLLPALLVDTETRWARLGVTLADPALLQLVVLPLGLAGGAAAAALGLSSFAALGLAFALGLFVGIGALLLPGALYFVPGFYSMLLPMSFVAPGVLLLLGSAFWCATRGEPAGYGAWKRALPLVLASLLLPPLGLLAANEPLAKWGEARSLEHHFTAPAAGHLSFERGNGAFIVDTRTAERIAFLPPFVSIWNGGFRADGQRLAAIQDVRLFGALPTGTSALTLYDGEGRLIRTLDREQLGCDPALAGWVGERLLTSCHEGSRGSKLVALDAEGRVEKTILDEVEGIWAPAGRDIHGRDLLCLRRWEGLDQWDTRLLALDPETAEIQEEPVARARGAHGPYCAERLSPGGRYFLSDTGSLTDLRDGSIVPIPGAPGEGDGARSRLVAGGQLLRLWTRRGDAQTRELELTDIESGESKLIRRWHHGDWVEFQTSPDRRLALLTVSRVTGEEAKETLEQEETWLLDVESGELSALPVPAFSWAGPDVLAVNDGQRLGLWRLGAPPQAVKPLR